MSNRNRVTRAARALVSSRTLTASLRTDAACCLERIQPDRGRVRRGLFRGPREARGSRRKSCLYRACVPDAGGAGPIVHQQGAPGRCDSGIVHGSPGGRSAGASRAGARAGRRARAKRAVRAVRGAVCGRAVRALRGIRVGKRTVGIRAALSRLCPGKVIPEGPVNLNT